MNYHHQSFVVMCVVMNYHHLLLWHQCIQRITEDEMTYYFHSTFQNTCLIIKLKRGEAVIETDNITAISVIEEVITKAATERKTKVNISFGKLLKRVATVNEHCDNGRLNRN